jgi:hypothetical protein
MKFRLPFFRIRLLGTATAGALALAASPGALEQDSEDPRPVLAFVAPPHVFPSEGGIAGKTPDLLPVYEHTRTAVVGVVQPVRDPQCDPKDVCRFDYYLAVQGGTDNKAAHNDVELRHFRATRL